MVCTVTTLNLASGWTSATYLSTLRSALIAAGWMTDWFDTFTESGYEHGVLRLVYDAGATYGTKFYLFSVQAGQYLYVQSGNGWDSATNRFTGTQYLDYHSVAPQLNPSWTAYANVNSAEAVTYRVFRSGVDPDFAVITCNDWRSEPFFQEAMLLVKPGMTLSPWIDLNKNDLNGLFFMQQTTSSVVPMLKLHSPNRCRRSALDGNTCRAFTDQASYNRNLMASMTYTSVSSTSNSQASNSNAEGLKIPSYYAANNPAYSANAAYIVTGLPWATMLTTDLMPSDIGMFAPYGTLSFNNGDVIEVAAGTNEWTVMTASNWTQDDRSSLLFLARTA